MESTQIQANTIQITNSLSKQDLDRHLINRVAQVLNRYYPNRLWSIRVDNSRSVGMLQILCDLSTRLGINIPLRDITPDPNSLERVVMRYAGELLERLPHVKH